MSDTSAKKAAAQLHGELLQGTPFFITLSRSFFDAIIIVSLGILILIQLFYRTSAPTCTLNLLESASSVQLTTCAFSFHTLARLCLVILFWFFASFTSTIFKAKDTFIHSSLVTFLSLFLLLILSFLFTPEFHLSILCLSLFASFTAFYYGYSFAMKRRASLSRKKSI